MTIEVPELAPCPFCGGEARIVSGDEAAYVQCEQVKMHRALWFQGDNAAADIVRDEWNRRAALAEPAKPSEGVTVADVAVLPNEDNSTYLRLIVEPKNEARREYRISVGGADVLFHELAGLAGATPSPPVQAEPAKPSEGRPDLDPKHVRYIAMLRHECAYNGPCADNGDGCTCSAVELGEHQQRRATLSPPVQAEAGWQLVPSEPTGDMRVAGAHIADQRPSEVAAVYRAMLAAVPPLKQEGV